jgi:hypothetical protein
MKLRFELRLDQKERIEIIKDLIKYYKFQD